MMMAARSPGAKLGVLKSARQRLRKFFEIGISEAGLFLIAVGFDQAGFVRPAVEGVAKAAPRHYIGRDSAFSILIFDFRLPIGKPVRDRRRLTVLMGLSRAWLGSAPPES